MNNQKTAPLVRNLQVVIENLAAINLHESDFRIDVKEWAASQSHIRLSVNAGPLASLIAQALEREAALFGALEYEGTRRSVQIQAVSNSAQGFNLDCTLL